jgi:hypothetical protein
MAITILDVVIDNVGQRDTYTYTDHLTSGVDMLGGCEQCAATLSSYNAYPSHSGYWRCANCIGTTGYPTVAAFRDDN